MTHDHLSTTATGDVELHPVTHNLIDLTDFQSEQDRHRRAIAGEVGVTVIGDPQNLLRAAGHPACAREQDSIPRITFDDQGVGRARHITHLIGTYGQTVVTGAANVPLFNPIQGWRSRSREVDVHARTRDSNRIGLGVGGIGGRQTAHIAVIIRVVNENIFARAANQGVLACTTIQGVAAAATFESLSAGTSHQAVFRIGTHIGHCHTGLHQDGGVVQSKRRVGHRRRSHRVDFGHRVALNPGPDQTCGVGAVTRDTQGAIGADRRDLIGPQGHHRIGCSGQTELFKSTDAPVCHRGQIGCPRQDQTIVTHATVDQQIGRIQHHIVVTLTGFNDVGTYAPSQRVACSRPSQDLKLVITCHRGVTGHIASNSIHRSDRGSSIDF